MTLDQLSAAAGGRIVRGDGSEEITDIAFDNARVERGSLFVCVRGMTADGHDFAESALLAGAVALALKLYGMW